MQSMKINLEFDSLEELDETLKGMSAGLYLLGDDLSARILCCKSNGTIEERYSEEEEEKYFNKVKELYGTLTDFYDYVKENQIDFN